MCPNKEDLKYCRNATSGGLTDATWKPIDATRDFLSCNHLDQQSDQKNLQGQQINPLQINDGRFFHCLNRRDENPFDAGKKNNEISNQKTWLDNVKKPCSLGSSYRRCLGGRVDQCVHGGSKFQTID